MPFIPHTRGDVEAMLATIGAPDIETLFDEIPAALKIGELKAIPSAMNEMQVTRLMHQRAAQDAGVLNFCGAGAYEHHIPAAVWQITTRGEFYSAYTPYQGEASQGTLQVIYEYQTMMARLTAMDVSNASLYDGASALAEAVLMAVRAQRKALPRVIIPGSLHPAYVKTLRTLVEPQEIELVVVPFDDDGRMDTTALQAALAEGAAAVAIQSPNFFGVIESIDELTDLIHAQGALVIGVVNPMSLALLKPPGEWGEQGADIVCGEGQPLGAPLSSGGPYFGLFCCRQKLVRQMPGRLVGRTVDVDGKPGFTLTLQAREQHIRRAKATSNICTNQGLLVTAATIYMAIMGDAGLRRTAAACHDNLNQLLDQVSELPGVSVKYNAPHFHEAVLSLPVPAKSVIKTLAKDRVLAGFDLGAEFEDHDNALLVCVTETKTAEDIKQFVAALQAAIS